MARLLYSPQDRDFSAHSRTVRLLHGAALALGLGTLYFLTAKLSQGLTLADGVAVFWPAAALSSGVLIALGPTARVPVGAAAIAASVGVHLLNAEPLWAGFALGLCNAAEALLIAWLVDHYFGPGIRLDRLREVVGLLVAAVAGTAVSGIGGATIYRLLASPSAPFVFSWHHWFASDLVGVIAGAPVVIGLVGLSREPPERLEFVEGVTILAVLVVTTGVVILLPPEPWHTVAPIALLCPMLLWLAARCRPFFAAAGAFVVSSTIVFTTIEGIGHFGDPDAATGNRILEAQASILFIAIGAFILAALFAERRQSELRLARAVMMLERARTNKMMTLEATAVAIAHEVRQPLMSITAYSSAARRWLKHAPLDRARVEHSLDGIESAGFRADQVLKTMRKLFQDTDRDLEPINLNGIVMDALVLSRGELDDHNIQTALELASQLPLVMGHRVQLQEVMVNLVHNAIDAMAPMEARHRLLKVRTRPNGGQAIVVEVQDSGRGIEAERIGRIFEPFVTTKANGTGMGLAICTRIVESHGGRLTVSSGDKSGATFQIALPTEGASQART